MSDLLPINFDAPIPAASCWYCGADSGDFEREHQRPVSRGGEARAGNLVMACADCNHLKRKLTLEEFRAALELRLGTSPVVFAGEASAERPATPIRAVRSFAATQAVVKLDPVVAERFGRAMNWLTRRGSGATRKEVASEAVTMWLDNLAAAELGGADFPELDPMLPFDEFGEPPIIQPGQDSKTPRWPVLDREVTKIASPVLDQARTAVRFLREVGEPTALVDFVTEAVAKRLDDLARRYPQFGERRRTVGGWVGASKSGDVNREAPE